MSDYETQQVIGWIGQTAYDSDGAELGRVETIYEDDDGSGPEWFAISTGSGGGDVRFVPVRGASSSGGRLVVPWAGDVVEGAPRCSVDGHLSPEEESRLYDYYGMDWTSGTSRGAGPETDRAMTGGDDAMTRSEEEVRVDTREREVGRARLRKWVETEQVNVTVPVRREVARLVTEPITDANVGKAMSGPDLTENEVDVVLSAEEVVVDKKVVPKERVRLEKDTVVDEQVVSEQVRKERIATEGDVGRTDDVR